MLIDHGADVNAVNQFGFAPIHAAVGDNHLEFAKLLIRSGANVRLRARSGQLPVDGAKTNEMRLLVGGRALKGHAAVTNSDGPALRALIAAGELDICAEDSEGDTVLHLAVMAAVTAPAHSCLRSPSETLP